ncbi:hypothetical protein IMX26_15520 [Clostridium sp. 'deep sea']|uniref:hypothetical protein n=1 Tax=Clostridium sp. 'deep sea' TaxID=2779445 RepID=UPI001896566C|nr:hypothetical protein [Clostridium sp. 'deep sea']QOR34850.1 hypothetical protein IMX26_15520 [Clostridium sp. 'deep sea']
MNIKENIIKHYLSNVYFIVGTAYAGKSTMCKMLSEKYKLHHCEENYNSNVIFKIINIKDQPNLSYFNTKTSWQQYLNRTPDEYERWVRGNSEELVGFEIAELIRVSQKQKVIVDTNLPIEILNEIADYHQVAVMLSHPKISAQRFFDREDPEKLFLLDQINKCDNPSKTYDNFAKCIEQINRTDYMKFKESSFFTIERKAGLWASQEETLKILAQHFQL